MTRTHRAPSVALLLALAACAAPSNDDALDDAFPADDLDPFERAIGVTCRAPEACSGAGETYTATYRVGTTDTTRLELLQSFVATLDGLPAGVAIVARPLRPVTGAPAPLLHVDVHEEANPAMPELTAATLRASGSAAIPGLRGGLPTLVPLSGEGFVTGRTYVLRIWADAAPAGGTGTTLVGLGAVIAPTYADGQAWRRTSRRAVASDPWAPARWRPAGTWDVAFAFTGTAGTPCASADACRAGLVCHAGACFQPSGVPLAISPSTITIAAGTTTGFVASGGDPPYAYTLAAGAGTLVGASYTAPAQTGSATVRVTDLLGASRDATITIVPPTRVEPCTGLIANAEWNTAQSITQTWTGSAWTPSTEGVYDPTASTTECRYRCVANATRIGTACVASSGIVQDGGGVRSWSDGTVAPTCAGYRFPEAGHEYSGATGNGVYRIDPDGALGLAAFPVWCEMTLGGGGWTLVAHHSDGRTRAAVAGTLRDVDWGVLTDARWQALRAVFGVGMLFVDEAGRVSQLSRAKLLGANCVPLTSTLMPAGNYLWHHETSGCGGSGSDYSLITLAAFATWGAAVYSQSVVTFDVWPYAADYSYNEQNELKYFIR